MTEAARPIFVEILYFDGCPNHDGAQRLVERVVADLAVQADVRMVNVPDPEAAKRERFLGSPSIRVDGRDIEPCASNREDYVLSCRVYRTDHGVVGQPEEEWLRQALAEAVR